MKKKLSIVLLLLLILPFICSLAPTESFYINDHAGVLTEEQEKRMLSSAASLADQTGAQVVVLTVNSLEGRDSSEYALEVARDWGIGDKEKNNGVLILLSTGDRDIRVEVGYGLEGCLPDGKTGRLIDEYAIPFYKENNFSEGTEQLFYAVLNIVRAEYGLEGADTNTPEEPETIPPIWGTLIMIIGIIVFIAVRVALAKRGIFIFGGFGGFGGPRGGGFGGGSGGFSGGGGGFGGGGAGRKF